MAQNKDKHPKSIDRASGHYHPLSQVMREMFLIFKDLGFEVALGNEVESEEYNFDKLNIPGDHPARDLWDTFWLRPEGQKSKVKSQKLLRTHTSPMQIRYMEENKPPLAIIVPGKTFRYEATDATHEAQFHQLEGLMIGKDVNLSNLKYILETFFERFFGKKMEVRFRPSYFPFVEPGIEVDMRKVGDDKWIEIMGAGMVHPRVLLNVGIDPRDYQGFAFGMGIDRLTMLKFGIDDVRLFYTGDLRLVRQFPTDTE